MDRRKLLFFVSIVLCSMLALTAPLNRGYATGNQPGPTTTTATQTVSLVMLTVSYSVTGAPPPHPPMFFYRSNGRTQNVSLSSQPTPYSVDYGSYWNVGVINASSQQERWAVPGPESGNIATAPENLTFHYHHEFELTAYYVAKPTQVVPLQPTLQLMVGGLPSSPPLTDQPSTRWADENSSWEVSQTLPGSSSQDRWRTENATGVVSGPGALGVTYTHQFLLTTMVSPPGSGATVIVNATGSSVWEDAGSPVSIQASPAKGFNFSAWSCTGEGCGESTQNVTQLIMNGPITLTATFSQVVAVTSESTSVAYGYNSTNLVEIAIVCAVVVVAPLLVIRRKKKRSPRLDTPSAGVSGLSYRAGFLSDLGRSRTNNEDAILMLEFLTTFDSKPGSAILSAVADGVGGSQKGEVASKLVLATLANQASQTLLGSEHTDRTGLLKTAVEAANEEVVKYGMTHRESEGLASTLVASIVEGEFCYIANVGDSRAYLVNRGGVKQVTKDHSQVQELVDSGKIASEESRHYPGRNIITRAVGASSDVQVDTYSLSVAPGDRVLLCTDGLWEPVTDEEIHRVVLDAVDPQTACVRLVQLANDRGGKDNISLTIVEIKGPIEATTQ